MILDENNIKASNGVKIIMMRKNMMGRGRMMGGGMMGGMMRGHMGFGPGAESEDDWYCPRCGGPYYREGGRQRIGGGEITPPIPPSGTITGFN